MLFDDLLETANAASFNGIYVAKKGGVRNYLTIVNTFDGVEFAPIVGYPVSTVLPTKFVATTR